MEQGKLNFTGGGGVLLTLFGLPFLIAGSAMLVAGLGGQIKMEGGGPASPLFYIPFSAIFILLGSAITFGRSGTTLDSDRRVLFTWWGLLFPFTKSEYSWDDCAWVSVRKKVVRSNKKTKVSYPVEIMGDQGNEINVQTVYSPLEARRVAEQAAKFMNLGVKDSSRGSEVVREAGTLDETVRDRIMRQEVELELTAAPTDAKSHLDISDGQACFDIPSPEFGPGHKLGAVFLLIVGTGVGAFFIVPILMMLSQGGGNVYVAAFWTVMGLATLVSIGPPILKMVLLALAAQKLVIDKSSLSLETTHRFGSQKNTIPLDQLEELEIMRPQSGSGQFLSGQHIQAVSDQTSLSFGQRLDTAELNWMKNTLEYMISKA